MVDPQRIKDFSDIFGDDPSKVTQVAADRLKTKLTAGVEELSLLDGKVQKAIKAFNTDPEAEIAKVADPALKAILTDLMPYAKSKKPKVAARPAPVPVVVATPAPAVAAPAVIIPPAATPAPAPAPAPGTPAVAVVVDPLAAPVVVVAPVAVAPAMAAPVASAPISTTPPSTTPVASLVSRNSEPKKGQNWWMWGSFVLIAMILVSLCAGGIYGGLQLLASNGGEEKVSDAPAAKAEVEESPKAEKPTEITKSGEVRLKLDSVEAVRAAVKDRSGICAACKEGAEDPIGAEACDAVAELCDQCESHRIVERSCDRLIRKHLDKMQ